MRAVGRRLEALRRRRGWTYREVERHTGIPKSSLQYLVRRRRSVPDHPALLRLVEILGGTWDAEWELLWQCAAEADPPSTADPSRPDASPLVAVTEAGQTWWPNRPVPKQLPRDVPAFIGRAKELDELDRKLPPADQIHPAGETGGGSTTAVISAVSGTAGIGKTALAVHWAHRVAAKFPDGQLYVNLRGFDSGGRVMPPAEAIRGFLDALGAPPERIPAGLDAQVALYRSLVAGKRTLVVLDNARDADQARLLLPGTSTALVIVTSRNQLTSLVAADGADALTLDLLTPAEARELLARRLGPERVIAEPQAVEEMIALCARLPLALTIVVARAAQSGFPLATLAAELGEAGGRLDALSAGDAVTEMRTVFSWSYATLTPAAARLFRLLGLHPGRDISAAAAASLAGHPRSAVRPLLAELTRASLLAEQTPDRYTFHDLLRAYAADLANTVDTDDQRQAGIGRVLDHFLHTACAAERLMHPHREPLALAPPRLGVTPEQPAGHVQAMTWFTTERAVLVALIHRAADAGFDTLTWQLAWSMTTFLDRQGLWHDWSTTQQTALTAARRLGNRHMQAFAERNKGLALAQLGCHDEADRYLQSALDTYRVLCDPAGQAHTHNSLARTHGQQSHYRDALSHVQQAARLFRAAGHSAGRARALNNVGWYHSLLGEHQKALEYCENALALHQEIGDGYGEANTWDSLGYVHHHLDHHAEATASYRKALELWREFGDRYNEADTLIRLGDTYHATSDIDAARHAWQEAQIILDKLGHPDSETVHIKLNGLTHLGRRS